MAIFREVTDIQTSDMLNLPLPKANYETVVVKPTAIQTEMVEELSKRAERIHGGGVDPSEDNMLKITSDGRKIGLDQRLINDMLPDDPNSKVNACTNKIFEVWEDTKANKSTQLMFCDISTPKENIWGLNKEQRKRIKHMSEAGKQQVLNRHIMETAENYTRGIYPGSFNLYDDIKAKLILKGIPEHEIVFIHDADTEGQKKKLFAKVRSGQVRVLMGSTFKMGVGTNVQDRIIMQHDLDCPWRPSDLAQRAGRTVRYGNKNEEVTVCRYVTEGTFDAYLWQTIEKKQQFISQIMTSKSPVRSCEDVDESVLSYAEIKALCAGDDRIREKMDLDIEVSRMRLLKSDYLSGRYTLEDKLLKEFPEGIASGKAAIKSLQSDMATFTAETKPGEGGLSPLLLNGVVYTEKAKAAEALHEACKTIRDTKEAKIGKYRGFDMYIYYSTTNQHHYIKLKGNMSYEAELGREILAKVTKLDEALEKIPQRLLSVETHVAQLEQDMKTAELELQKPFHLEKELSEKSARLDYLNAALSLNRNDNTQENQEPPVGASDRAIAKKPSILGDLQANAPMVGTATGNTAVGLSKKQEAIVG